MLQPSYVFCEEPPPPMAANGRQWPPMAADGVQRAPDRWCLTETQPSAVVSAALERATPPPGVCLKCEVRQMDEFSF